MKKYVLLHVSPEGETHVEAEGFKGKSCKDATKFLTDILGDVKDTKKKTEWYMRNTDNLRVSRKLGVNGAKLCG